MKKQEKGRISQREVGVGMRLKEIREELKYSQSEFGAQVGIAKKRLGSYEEARVPLRFDLALRICRQFIISEKWLATGKGNMRLLLDLSAEPATHKVPLDTPFGKAFETFLAPLYERIFQEQKGQIRIRLGFGEENGFIINLFNYLIPYWSSLLKKEEVGEFLGIILDFSRGVMDEYERDGRLPMIQQLKPQELQQPLTHK